MQLPCPTITQFADIFLSPYGLALTQWVILFAILLINCDLYCHIRNEVIDTQKLKRYTVQRHHVIIFHTCTYFQITECDSIINILWLLPYSCIGVQKVLIYKSPMNTFYLDTLHIDLIGISCLHSTTYHLQHNDWIIITDITEYLIQSGTDLGRRRLACVKAHVQRCSLKTLHLPYLTLPPKVLWDFLTNEKHETCFSN